MVDLKKNTRLLHKEGQKLKELQKVASAEAGAARYWIPAVAWLFYASGESQLDLRPRSDQTGLKSLKN